MRDLLDKLWILDGLIRVITEVHSTVRATPIIIEAIVRANLVLDL